MSSAAGTSDDPLHIDEGSDDQQDGPPSSTTPTPTATSTSTTTSTDSDGGPDLTDEQRMTLIQFQVSKLRLILICSLRPSRREDFS